MVSLWFRCTCGSAKAALEVGACWAGFQPASWCNHLQLHLEASRHVHADNTSFLRDSPGDSDALLAGQNAVPWLYGVDGHFSLSLEKTPTSSNNKMQSCTPGGPLHDRVGGYPKLAAQMEILPELAIFRRFGALNAQNLLYMQAELTSLEEDLQEQQLFDSRSPEGNRVRHATDWHWLSVSRNTGTGEQQELVLKIRKVLKDYSIWIQPHKDCTRADFRRRCLDPTSSNPQVP